MELIILGIVLFVFLIVWGVDGRLRVGLLWGAGAAVLGIIALILFAALL